MRGWLKGRSPPAATPPASQPPLTLPLKLGLKLAVLVALYDCNQSHRMASRKREHQFR
jgi:hypothetical protein